MDRAIEKTPQVDLEERVLQLVHDMAGARFDNLIEIRDYAQVLIDKEKDAHEQALKAKAEALRKQLAEHTAQISGLETRVRAGKRATRADAGQPRKKADK